MAAHAARRLLPMAENLTQILAIELLAACQGCDFHAPLASSEPLERCAHAFATRCRISATTATWLPTSRRLQPGQVWRRGRGRRHCVA